MFQQKHLSSWLEELATTPVSHQIDEFVRRHNLDQKCVSYQSCERDGYVGTKFDFSQHIYLNTSLSVREYVEKV